jgi:hypothetical protein
VPTCENRPWEDDNANGQGGSALSKEESSFSEEKEAKRLFKYELPKSPTSCSSAISQIQQHRPEATPLAVTLYA